ncbi:MAG: glycosyltransferase [Mariniblastus sp.]
MSQFTQVDIAICTWNRCAFLKQTLDSISRLNVEKNVGLRLIVVDNNSADGTAAVLEKFKRSPFAAVHQFFPLQEPKQGHTHARNCAVRFIRQQSGTDLRDSELVVWTDDDVLVGEDWITKYVAAAKENPTVDFFGSVIEPKFVGDVPVWVTENWDTVKGCFAHRDLGSEAVEFSKSCLPYGANFAIRAKVQIQFEFDTTLGRRGASVMGEDELELMRRLIEAGHSGQWVPRAAVEHLIPDDRMCEKFLYSYFVGQGAALYAKGESTFADLKAMHREVRLQYLLYKLKRRVCASPTWMAHLVRSALAKGQAEELVGKKH